MLATLVVAFLLLAGATGATRSRSGKPLVPRHLALATAGVLAFAFFGYTFGRDVAVHDNVLVCQAPAILIDPSTQPFVPDGYAASQFQRGTLPDRGLRAR